MTAAFPVCHMCKGTTWILTERCPCCVEGVVVTDELVEVGAKAVYAMEWGNHHPNLNDAYLEKAKHQTEAVLSATIRHLKAQVDPSSERLGDT